MWTDGQKNECNELSASELVASAETQLKLL